MSPQNADLNARFIEAARGSKTDSVKTLIDKGASINAKDKEGKTALTHAAFNGRLETVKLLLAHNAAVNRPDNYGGTPLFWAVCGAHLEIVKLLLAHGAAMNTKTNDGHTPFLRAASGISKPAHIDIMKLFLESGADINQTDNNGVTALMNAASGGYTEITRLLLDHGADVSIRSRQGETAITRACRAFKKDRPEIVKMLIDHGADIYVTDNWNHHASLLYLAAQNGHTGIVSLLLDKGMDINEKNGAVIRTACDHDRLKTVQLLIDRGADVNLADPDGRTALMAAVSQRFNEMAYLLIDAGADANAVTSQKSWGGDRNVLMFALGIEDSYWYERSTPPKIDTGLIERLLEKGADANYKNKAGITPLHLARQKKLRIIGLLKKYGAKEYKHFKTSSKPRT